MIDVTSFSNNGHNILTLVQKTIIEILNKEGKKHKGYCAKSWLFPNSVSKFLHGKVVGKKKCGWKLATTERDDRSLERIVRSNHINNLVEITMGCQDHGVTVSWATIHRQLQEMGYRSCIPVTEPLLNFPGLQIHQISIHREFVGTGEKENIEGAIKHPRGTQKCHSKSVELCHTWGLLPSSFVHATAHSGSYCSEGCCYQILTILNCYENSCFY